jgi:hypothetical protein
LIYLEIENGFCVTKIGPKPKPISFLKTKTDALPSGPKPNLISFFKTKTKTDALPSGPQHYFLVVFDEAKK